MRAADHQHVTLDDTCARKVIADSKGEVFVPPLMVHLKPNLSTSESRQTDGGALIPMFANYIHALNKNVMHDEQVAGNWNLDGSKAAERWWFS